MIANDDVVMIRWGVIDIDNIVKAEDLVKATKLKVGKVSVISVVPSSSPVPDDAARKRMGVSIKLFQEICESINLVFEGRGLKIAAARSVAASIFLVSGNRKMSMFSSFEEAVTKQMPTKADRLKTVALASGVFIPGA
jgi:hypothetical protein